MRIEELAAFLREFRQHFHETGAITPSSRSLARALVRGFREGSPGHGRRLLEVGPGTGALTREILRWLRPGDRLDLCEANENFVSFLSRRLEEDPEFRDRRGQIRIHKMRIEDLDPETRYDHIVSGLPLNNFSPEAVDQILSHLLSILVPGGTLSYFEYVGVRSLGRVFAGPGARKRLKGVDRVMRRYRIRHETESEVVLGNLPPARALTLRRDRGEGESAQTCRVRKE